MARCIPIRHRTTGAAVTGASITGAKAVGARLLGPTAIGPLAIAVSAVGAIAIGRRAIANAVIRKLRAEEIEIGSLKVREAGNLLADPELRYTLNGTVVVNFRIASTARYKGDGGQWQDGDTLFMGVTAWRDLAENVAESARKATG